MTKEEKIKFINDILESTKESLISKVDHIPEQWDGLELRQLIADKVAENVNYIPIKGRRLKEYRNDCIVLNI